MVQVRRLSTRQTIPRVAERPPGRSLGRQGRVHQQCSSSLPGGRRMALPLFLTLTRVHAGLRHLLQLPIRLGVTVCRV